MDSLLRALWLGTLQGRPEGVMLASLLLVIVLGTQIQRNGSYPQTRTSIEVTFHEPWAIRAFVASLSGWFVFLLASVASEVASEPLPPKPFPWWPVLLVCGAVTVGVFRRVGPNQISFDPQQHAYHSMSRWSWTPKIRSGNYDELSGIYVRRASVEGSAFYSVGLAWKDTSERSSRLGRFSQVERAEAFASELSQTLALPRVEPPSLRKEKLPSSQTK